MGKVVTNAPEASGMRPDTAALRAQTLSFLIRGKLSSPREANAHCVAKKIPETPILSAGRLAKMPQRPQY